LTLREADQDAMRALLLVDPITVTPESESDDFDPDWTPGTPVQAVAYVVPMDALEDEILRDTRVTRYRVTVAPDCPVTATSRIAWSGKDLEVIGEPLETSDQGLRLLEFIATEIKG